MNKPYLILVNGVLWARKLTRIGAEKVASQLKEKGLKATVAYQIEKEYMPLTGGR